VIAITISEKEAICKKFPNVKIVRTMKQDSKRHHYYMEEQFAPMRYLMTLRGLDKKKPQRQRNKNVTKK